MENKKDFLNKLPRFIKDNPTSGAYLSKLVNYRKKYAPINNLESESKNIVDSNIKKLEYNENILQLFPDIELPIQILVSSIISPNDMLSVNLNYDYNKNLKLPNNIKHTVLDIIKNYIRSEYNIESKLYEILKESLFTKGAYAEIILPEATLDDIINNPSSLSLESLSNYYDDPRNRKTLFLSDNKSQVKINNKKYSSEEYLSVEVTENSSILKLTSVANEKRKRKSSIKYKNYFNSSISMEDREKLDNFFKKENTFKENIIGAVNAPNSSSRKNITKPMVMKIPIESIIPVHIKNNPKAHLGYFIALDENGTPLTYQSYDTDANGSMYSFLEGEEHIDPKSSLIRKARTELRGMTSEVPGLSSIENFYNKILKNYLKEKLNSEELGGLANFADNLSIYNTMFNRAMANQKTRLLYVPEEVMSYIAFSYRDNGTGESLIEKSSILYSIRSILFFTKVMANIRNSITNTDINVTLGENITNPTSVMETIMSEVLKTRETLFPVGIGRIDDIVNFLHRTGYKFNFKHPSLPEIDIEQNESSRSMTIPDMDFDNSVNEMILMSFGLTAEIVQSGIESDFATTIAAKNMLFAKRINTLQEATNTIITSHIKKLLYNDPIIKKKIEDVFRNESKSLNDFFKDAKEALGGKNDISLDDLIDYAISLFIDDMSVHLPKIETIEANGSKAAFEDYKTILTDAVDLMFDSTILTEDLVGPISNNLDSIKSIIKSVSLNKWLTENNYLPELSQFLTKDDDGKPVFNMLGDFLTTYQNLFESYIKFNSDSKISAAKQRKIMGDLEGKINDVITKLEAPEEEQTSDLTNEGEGASLKPDSKKIGTPVSKDEGEGEGSDKETEGGSGDDEGFEGFGDIDEDFSEDSDKENKYTNGRVETDSDRDLKQARAEKEHYSAQLAKIKAEVASRKSGVNIEKFNSKKNKEDANPTDDEIADNFEIQEEEVEKTDEDKKPSGPTEKKIGEPIK